jgi:hypothetical protein
LLSRRATCAKQEQKNQIGNKMKNTLPQKLDRLFSQAEDMADGCNAHEVALGLQQNKELNMRTDLAAARAADNTYQAAKTGKLNAVQAQTTADRNASAFIMLARDVLKPHLGTTWSQMWAEAGFVGGSLSVPDALAERMALLMSLNMYFTAHNAQEVASAGVTHGAAFDLHTAFSAARSTVNACRADVGVKKASRDTAVKALRTRMRGLITELTQLLPGDDARWNAFALNMPDAVGIPEVPDGLTVIGGGTGHLLANWESAPLADRYRVFKKVTGVDSDYVLATTVTDTESNLNTFTPGQIVRVRIVAVNDAGVSVPSNSVEQTVP